MVLPTHEQAAAYYDMNVKRTMNMHVNREKTLYHIIQCPAISLGLRLTISICQLTQNCARNIQ